MGAMDKLILGWGTSLQELFWMAKRRQISLTLQDPTMSILWGLKRWLTYCQKGTGPLLTLDVGRCSSSPTFCVLVGGITDWLPQLILISTHRFPCCEGNQRVLEGKCSSRGTKGPRERLFLLKRDPLTRRAVPMSTRCPATLDGLRYQWGCRKT